MKLMAQTPVATSSAEAIVYDQYWIAGLQIKAWDPNGKVNVTANLLPARDVTVDGVTTKEVDRNNGMYVKINDVFAKIGADPNGPLAQAFGAILIALVSETPELTIV